MLPLVEQLATTWTSLSDLLDGLGEADWKRPTGCPGWSVQDNVSHLVDYESFALGRPRPSHDVGALPHLRNEMGTMNEVGVAARRGLPGASVLAELREVTAERLVGLRELTTADLDRPTVTPIGKGTVRDLLTLRVMDSWLHEQDIRRAIGRPGHVSGSAVETAVGYLAGFLPYVIAKRAAAPDGTTAVVQVGDLPPFGVEVTDGRGRSTPDLPAEPAVVLRVDVGNFAALTGGRSDAHPEGVEIAGDVALGRRIVAQLGFLP